MAPALFTVKATITPEREQAFNECHPSGAPDAFKWKGVGSARRYRAILAEDRFQHMAYEFESEETLRRLLGSRHLHWLKQEYDRNFGGASDRQRAAYVQVAVAGEPA